MAPLPANTQIHEDTMRFYPLVFFFSFLLLLFTNGQKVFAQNGKDVWSTTSSKAIKNIEKAKIAFDQHKDAEAIDLLNKAIDADGNFVEAYIMLAEVYSENKKVELAIETAKKAIAINPDFFPSIFFNMANWEMYLGLYEDAKLHATQFLKYPKVSGNSRVMGEKLLASASFSVWAVKNPVPFNPVNLGAGVNSPLNEYLPSLTADEQTLYITVRLQKDPNQPNNPRLMQEDFFVSNREGNQWGTRRNLGPPVNTEGNEGAQCISADGNFLFFTACQEEFGYPGGRKGFGSCDLFFAQKMGGRWSEPMNAGGPISTKYWDSQPCLNADGTVLYFISNRPGGKGGMDIWRSVLKSDGTWANPENLGDSINTAGHEESPFLHPDGSTFYFSSDGHPGLGNSDLFRSKLKEDGKFSSPVNLGYPINTKGDERDMVVSATGKLAFFSSQREGGFGQQDIYSFELPPAMQATPVNYVRGMVFSSETKKGLSAKLELIDLASGKVVQQVIAEPGTGNYLVCLPTGKDYALNVSKNGYLFHSENFSLQGNNPGKPYQINVGLNTLKPGEKVVLKNIFFKTASFELEKSSTVELDKLVDFLTKNAGAKIELGGHTDNVGDKKSNQLLSENRAKAVMNYLISKGIDAARLSAAGYGDAQPVQSNDTEDGRAANRRTEFKIL
jgi:outer membrane protein OmpA-like peptidoglycan-associated protein